MHQSFEDDQLSRDLTHVEISAPCVEISTPCIEISTLGVGISILDVGICILGVGISALRIFTHSAHPTFTLPMQQGHEPVI